MSAPSSQTAEHRQALGPVDLATEPDFSLGSVIVKPSARELVHANNVEVLEPRIMQVLVALSRHVDQVVSRDQLIELCWAGRIVGEDAIQRCITKIRRLAESYGGFELHTIARVGYRLTVNAPAVTAQLSSEVASTSSPKRKTAAMITLAVFGVAATLAMGIARWLADRQEEARLSQSLVTIEELIGKDKFGAAFTAAYPLSRVARNRVDARFAKLWKKIIVPMRPLVAEADATVYFKPYEDVDGEWIAAGTTPVREWVEAPRATLRIKVEKAGFRTGYFAIAVPGPSVEIETPSLQMGPPPQPIPLPLIANDTLPDNMVLVPRTDVPVYLSGWVPELVGGQRYDIPAFAIARYEVTNREFKEFVAAGGYDDERFWSGLHFMKRGQPLSWHEARTHFVDSTQRPGPAGWQLSTYPREQADLPVGGISWYEAAAYARFRGQALPTIHHWLRAGFSPFSAIFYTTPTIAAASHFQAKEPLSAHSEIGLGPWGTYHMLGNAREWVSNFAGNDAVALGSSWSAFGPDSIATYTADPMLRAPSHGFRLMQTLNDSPIEAQLLAPIKLVRDTDRFKRDPVSDEAFKAMRFQFSMAKPAPIAIDKQEVQRSELYVIEKVTLQYADDAPTTLHIAWPTARQSRPLQAVIFGPGGNCCFAKRDNQDNVENLHEVEFVPNSGRVLVMPIWAFAYERFEPRPLDQEQRLDQGRRAALAWHRDLSATIDYIESLASVDATKVAYIGYSLGATSTGVTLAVEPRVKAVVFISAGVILSRQVHPMVDIVNYAPRITAPILIMNGRYDHSHPFETSQQRLFNLLGTPAKDKRLLIYDTGHYSFGSNAVAAEASNWFDRYLGPVH